MLSHTAERAWLGYRVEHTNYASPASSATPSGRSTGTNRSCRAAASHPSELLHQQDTLPDLDTGKANAHCGRVRRQHDKPEAPLSDSGTALKDDAVVRCPRPLPSRRGAPSAAPRTSNFATAHQPYVDCESALVQSFGNVTDDPVER